MKIKKISVATTPTLKGKAPAPKTSTLAKGVAAKVTAGLAAQAQKSSAAVPAQSPSAAGQPAPRSGANRGVTSGLRVMQFQDRTFSENDAKVRPTLTGPGFRTDKELAAEWCAEFPNSLAVQRGRITEAMITSVRHLYNNGTGGHGVQGTRFTSKPYVLDAKGARTTIEVVARTRTVGVKKTEAPASAPAVITPTQVAKTAGKLVKPVAKVVAKSGKKKAA